MPASSDFAATSFTFSSKALGSSCIRLPFFPGSSSVSGPFLRHARGPLQAQFPVYLAPAPACPGAFSEQLTLSVKARGRMDASCRSHACVGWRSDGFFVQSSSCHTTPKWKAKMNTITASLLTASGAAVLLLPPVTTDVFPAPYGFYTFCRCSCRAAVFTARASVVILICLHTVPHNLKGS